MIERTDTSKYCAWVCHVIDSTCKGRLYQQYDVCYIHVPKNNRISFLESDIYICNNSTYRWAQLKDALIDNRSKLGEAQTLQQFSRDADEMENWLQEKLQIASDESYKDPSNIQVLKQVIMLLSVTSPKIKLK